MDGLLADYPALWFWIASGDQLAPLMSAFRVDSRRRDGRDWTFASSGPPSGLLVLGNTPKPSSPFLQRPPRWAR